MKTGYVILVTTVVCLIVFACAYLFTNYLESHGMTVKKISRLKSGLSMAQTLASAIKPFLPGYADSVIDLVLKYTQEGVERAEETYKASLATGENANDLRAEEASNWIQDALKAQKIQITPEIKKLVDAVTPIFVRALPPTHKKVPAAK